MLLTTYEPEIVLPRCDADSVTVNVLGHLGSDISPVMTYLNATQPGALYHAQGQTLRFRFEGHMVTLRPREIAVGGLVDGDEAVEVLARLQWLINDTWERRTEIEPSTLQRKRLTPLEVYRLLPGSNCRACGEPTCLVFASKLVVGQVDAAQCPPLCQEERHRQRWQQLEALLEAAP